MKNKTNNSIENDSRPDLSEQYKLSLAREAELLGKLVNKLTRAEHDAITMKRVQAIKETERLRIEILRSDALFMAANNNFAGRSKFPAIR